MLLRASLTRPLRIDHVLNRALDTATLSADALVGTLEPFDLLKRLAPPGSAELLDFGTIRHEDITPYHGAPNWSSERNAAEFVGRLAAFMRAKTVVELGCFIGYTTAHIATALKTCNGHVYFVDLEKRAVEATRANLERMGLAQFGTPLVGPSCDSTMMAQLPAEINLAFIDTSHGYDDTVQEIETYGRRLSAGGCLVLHDTVRCPGVRIAVDRARRAFDLFTYATEGGNGVSVLVPKRKGQS